MGREKYISIENIFWRILFAWKFIIVTAVVFGIALPSIKYAYDRFSYNKLMNTYVNEESFSEEEINQIERYQDLTYRLIDLENYQEFSLYANANPLKVYQKELEVKINNTEDFSPIINEYMENFSSSVFANKFVESMGVEESKKGYCVEAIQELINISYRIQENGDCVICLKIIYEDEEYIGHTSVKYQELIESVEEYIFEDKRIQLIGQSNIKVDVSDVVAVQDEIKNMLSDYEKEVAEIDQQMNGIQKQYLLRDKETNELWDYKNSVVIPKFDYKKVIVGVVIGIILACAIIFVKVLFSNKLQDVDELNDFYGIKTLGIININERKQLKNRIDRGLYKIKYREVNAATYDSIVASICVACKNADVSNIFVTGSSDMSKYSDNDVYRKVVKKLGESGINIEEGESIVNNADSYMRMTEIGAVVFIECVDKSMYRDIESQCVKAHDSETKILGCIIAI